MLDRINTRVYGSDKAMAYASAKANMELMLRYKKAFNFIRNGQKLLADLIDIKDRFDKENFLTEKQLSYINESMYERFWSGFSKAKNDPKLAGATTHHDIRKSLRF